MGSDPTGRHDPARQEQFLEVVDCDVALSRFRAAVSVARQSEVIPLEQAWGRVLASDIAALVDVPAFDRADVDGWAVRAADTFEANEERPALLQDTGERLACGVVPRLELRPGCATSIATGAVMPRGADAVVMIEDAERHDQGVALRRAVAPGTNISFAGSDVARGETVLRRGQVLSARETAVLAAVGIDKVPVFARPKVAILSTGNEIVPPGTPLGPGLIHDSNQTALADTVWELGGEPVRLGIVRDDEDELRLALERALDCDLVLLSGGTSKGAGDLAYRVVGELGPPGIVVHGVAQKPGKPLCLAVARGTPIAVLPGFPTSAIMTFREFLGPLVREMAGLPVEEARTSTARLPMRINSARGRTEYVLVSLLAPGHARADEGRAPTPLGPSPEWLAYPLGKGSGSVTTFGQADGYVTIPRNREYLEAGERVTVRLLAPHVVLADLVVIGSHCVGLDWLLGRLMDRGFSSKLLAVGSTGGLAAARRGECDLAGIHLLDPATGQYNRPFVPPGVRWRPGYRRRQGIVFRPGDRRFEDQTFAEAMAAALADPACRMVNRNRGSGTRILIDEILGARRPEGYGIQPKSHHAVAAAVAQGRADWGMAIELVSRQAGLGFLPYRDEEYDFLVPADREERPAIRAFFAILAEPQTREHLHSMGFVVSDQASLRAGSA